MNKNWKKNTSVSSSIPLKKPLDGAILDALKVAKKLSNLFISTLGRRSGYVTISGASCYRTWASSEQDASMCQIERPSRKFLFPFIASYRIELDNRIRKPSMAFFCAGFLGVFLVEQCESLKVEIGHLPLPRIWETKRGCGRSLGRDSAPFNQSRFPDWQKRRICFPYTWREWPVNWY